MKKLVMMILLALMAIAASLFLYFRHQANQVYQAKRAMLHENDVSGNVEQIDLEQIESLPAPVKKYFELSISKEAVFVKTAQFLQEGILRTDIKKDQWMNFEAEQIVTLFRPGFLWRAKVKMFPLVHVQVLDSYISGIGSGEVRLLSAFRIGLSEKDQEMNSGALHRYLAEAVWYPPALLPQSGVKWTAIDDSKALATLTDGDTTVDLEFWFAPNGEIAGIYTPGRWGSFEGGYRKVAWEGHFKDYFFESGFRIPKYGEVGWYDSGTWQAVWKGTVLRTEFKN